MKNKLQFDREVILQVLAKINSQIEKFKLNDEISAIEKLEKDVISKYEKLYLALENTKELPKDEKISEYIDKIMAESGLTNEYIKSQMEKREKYKGNSGAEVVKRLYEYELKKYTKSRNTLLEKANILLKNEEKLNLELSNAVQESEQFEIIDKLSPIRQEFSKIENKVVEIQKDIVKLNQKLSTKWSYEIYGTIPEKEMLKTFNSVVGGGKND